MNGNSLPMRWLQHIVDFVFWPIRWFEGLVWRLSHPPLPTFNVDNQGFSVCERDRLPDRYRWDEVGRIIAFKNDLGTVDEICLQIDIGRRVQPLIISEEFGGYSEFVTAMEAYLPDVKKDWWSVVAFPAFAENATVIYAKSESVVPPESPYSPRNRS